MNAEKKLVDMLDDFDNAMLVTHSQDDGLAARPMAIAEIDADGGLWFVTGKNSGKVADLRLDSGVAITMQSSNKFVSLSATAHLHQDRAKINAMWKEAWRVWFPDGKESSEIALLHVVPDRGEYWDNSGATGLKYLVKAGVAYLSGDRPTTDESTNAAVSLDR